MEVRSMKLSSSKWEDKLSRKGESGRWEKHWYLRLPTQYQVGLAVVTVIYS